MKSNLPAQEKINEYARQQLKRAREETGGTQSELCKAIGKRRNNISDMERGRLEISFADMVLMAEKLGKSLEWFVK
jgi:transcriptional regulator with XRE-family HTH domain